MRSDSDRCSDRLLTISVDDGHPSDLRLADLLADLDLKATFYVPARNPERPVMDAAEVRSLSSRFELGAHTYDHVRLTDLAATAAARQIRDGKAWLEDVTSAPVDAFCYPRGSFDRHIARLVAEAGFSGARTTMDCLVSHPKDRFRAGTTTQAYSHPRSTRVRHAVKERNLLGVWNFSTVFRQTTDWVAHFQMGTEHVWRNGGVAHLWLHSWELDENDDWDRLATLLRRVRSDYAFDCVTNGDLFRRVATAR